MNENIDLTKILKDCAKSTKLYSSLFGEVEFQQVKLGFTYPIVIKLKDGLIESLTSNGKLFDRYDGECILFPSREQHDWSNFTVPWYKKDKFDPKTLKPFDKVLVRDDAIHTWKCNLFSNIIKDGSYPYKCVGNAYACCIPYNDDTKHLIGTNEEAPEYYRYWEN